MKKLFFLTLLLTTFFSCKKDDIGDEIAPFVGAYDYEYVTTGQDDTGDYSFTGTGVMLVANNGSNQNLLLTDDDGTTYLGFYQGEGSFQIIEDLKDYGSGDVYKISGEGFFGNQKMQLILTVEATNYFDKAVITMKGDKK